MFEKLTPLATQAHLRHYWSHEHPDATTPISNDAAWAWIAPYLPISVLLVIVRQHLVLLFHRSPEVCQNPVGWTERLGR
jgi:hypothetical protein